MNRIILVQSHIVNRTWTKSVKIKPSYQKLKSLLTLNPLCFSFYKVDEEKISFIVCLPVNKVSGTSSKKKIYFVLYSLSFYVLNSVINYRLHLHL